MNLHDAYAMIRHRLATGQQEDANAVYDYYTTELARSNLSQAQRIGRLWTLGLARWGAHVVEIDPATGTPLRAS